MNVFVDYSILDHLLRVQDGRYTGQYAKILSKIKEHAKKANVQYYVAENSRVEGVIGIQRSLASKEQKQKYKTRDKEKVHIANEMNAIRVPYPCSKTNDEYSLLDLSFRCAGQFWKDANDFENVLLKVEGMSTGDARQIVSMVYGIKEAESIARIDYFLAKDDDLIKGINSEKACGKLRELENIEFVSPEDFVKIINAVKY